MITAEKLSGETFSGVILFMGVVRLRSSLSLSVLVHALFILAWAVVFSQQAAKQDVKKLTWIELDPLPKSLTQTRKKESEPTKRIVQTAEGTRTETAAPDAYLGERTQTVDQQTVSKRRETHVGSAPRTRPAPTQAQSADSAREKSVAQATPKALSKLGVPILPKAWNHAPKPEQPNWAMGEGLSQDYVTGLKESERTALNTREYVFYGYFQRIRQRLDRSWNSQLRDKLVKLYRGGRKLASDMDHRTKTLVTLNAAGEIIRVQVLEESGTTDLDDAAIKAFNSAGPFPNPPKGIVDPNGLVQIRWEFVLRT